MNNLQNKVLKGLAITAVSLGIGIAVHAQLPPPPTPTTAPTQVPLDGGVILLAAAGAAYGAKKVYNKRKSKIYKEKPR